MLLINIVPGIMDAVLTHLEHKAQEEEERMIERHVMERTDRMFEAMRQTEAGKNGNAE